MHFIPVASLDPYQLDLESGVFVLEHKSRTLTRSPIVRLAPPDTPPHDLRLRIRYATASQAGGQHGSQRQPAGVLAALAKRLQRRMH